MLKWRMADYGRAPEANMDIAFWLFNNMTEKRLESAVRFLERHLEKRIRESAPIAEVRTIWVFLETYKAGHRY